jgi:hypothetical protein
MIPNEEECEKIILKAGWFRLKLGWYHVNAWNYPGWYDSPRCYATARKCYEREFLPDYPT